MLIAANSICIAEMNRRKIPDTGDKAKTASQKLLSALPQEAAKSYDCIYQLALELKDDISEGEFKTLVENYLAALVEFAEGQPQGPGKLAPVSSSVV
jgi:hypothetical protein